MELVLYSKLLKYYIMPINHIGLVICLVVHDFITQRFSLEGLTGT